MSLGLYDHYAMAADGTIWTFHKTSNGGVVDHLDGQGNDLHEGFELPNFEIYDYGFAYYSGRVYLDVAGDGETVLYNFPVANPSAYTFSDFETQNRFGSSGAVLRVAANGSAAAAMGGKIAALNFNDVDKSPYYPQLFAGAGINKYLGTEFEGCVFNAEGVVLGEQSGCGHEPGREPAQGAADGFGGASDISLGDQQAFVTEAGADRVTEVEFGVGGPDVGFHFGGPGTGASQLDGPVSIVRQPGTARLYVSELYNHRISVFDTAGGYIASFGNGVLDGGAGFESCGIELGSCRAGHDDADSTFGQLDFAPNGNLYAYEPKAGRVEIFTLGDGVPNPGAGGGSESGGGAGGGGGGGSPPANMPAPKPLLCRKGFKKSTVKGKTRCVRRKKKHHRHHHKRDL